MADTNTDTSADQSEQSQPNGHTTPPQQSLIVRRVGRREGEDGKGRERRKSGWGKEGKREGGRE